MSGPMPALLVAGRELRSTFLQPLAWVVLTALWFFTGLSFWSVVSISGVYSLPAIEMQRALFTATLFWLPLLVALPVIAMRLIAEERQTGTIETLLTAPITENQVALGKFLAGLGFFLVLLTPFPIYLGLLARFGEVDLGAAMAGLLGMVLVGGFFLAAAVCASALTRNQIVAAIVGFVAVLSLYVAPLFGSQLAQSGPWNTVWTHLNLLDTLDTFAKGVVSTRRALYPVSGIVFFVFATARLIEISKGK